MRTELPFQERKSYDEFVEDILTQIATHPFNVSVNEGESNEYDIYLEIDCHPEDRGRLIGKQGFVIKSVHRLLVAVSEGKKIGLQLLEE